MNLKPTIKNIRDSGLTVKGWAVKNGFRYQTVVKVLNGHAGKRQIGITAEMVKKLKRDRFYEESAK